MSVIEQGEVMDLDPFEEPVGQLTSADSTYKVPRLRRGKFRTDWPNRWLRAYVHYGTVTAACRASGVSRQTFYALRDNNEDFARLYKMADEMITESLEQEAIRRAIDGSDSMLQFMLRSRKPELYSEQHRIIHAGGATVTHEHIIPGSPEEQRELEAFGMPAALHIAAGPDAVPPPEQT